LKASDYIAKTLEKKGIKFVFELSGGMITHILDSLNQQTEIQIISMHHEQSAAFAAEGFARMTGIPGIALATSGPGATNLLTGIGSCYFDSVPCIFITGQVNRHEMKLERNIRQLGFQETDIVSMAKPITKACFQITDPNELPYKLELAFEISTSGRPGPVLIDIPMDVQRSNIEITPLKNKIKELIDFKTSLIYDLINDINISMKPLILCGRGIRASNSITLFKNFATTTKIPIVSSLLGLDVISYEDSQRVGFIGSYGNRWSNIALGNCDLLIVLGSRLDIRQTGADTNHFQNRKIYHIDCEKGEINNRIIGCVPIISDLKYFFEKFNNIACDHEFEIKSDWIKFIEKEKLKWPDTKEVVAIGINPNVFMHLISSNSKKAAAYLADVGSHQMWAAQSLEIGINQQFLTSGGMGAMGFSLPASIGACLAVNKSPVIVLIGDGCMQLNIQELQTISRNKLPIKIIVFNNESLGMIRQFQDSYFESRYQSTSWGYSAPDFEKVAIAYGIQAKTINNENEVLSAINWLWESKNEFQPQLLQVMINPQTNTYPKLAFGRPITEMEPFVKPLDMEGT
jgi:acetolactate synthase-1/2/3 large subunit